MTLTILAEKSDLRIAIMRIDELKPHEKGSPLYLELLKQELLKDNMLEYPVIADEKTGTILDGTHRWLALKSLGCTLIPVILVDALQDSRIRIGKRRIDRYTEEPSSKITMEEVISAALSGRLMNPKSTRHFFPFSKFQQINYPLQLLGKKTPKDVSRYLASMTERQCNLAIKEWFKEISEELEFLTKRKEEVEKEMNGFLSRVKI